MDNLARKIAACSPANWIASNGSQWIDTGRIWSASCKVELKYRSTAYLTSGEAKFCGGADTRNAGLYGIGIGRTLNYIALWAFGTNYVVAPSITRANALNVDLVDTLDLSNGAFTTLRDGVTSYTTFTTPVNYVGTSSVYLFKDHSPAYPYPAVGRIYYYKLWASGALIQHLVPYVVNGTACMRDLISGAFYANKGSGALSHG